MYDDICVTFLFINVKRQVQEYYKKALLIDARD